MCVALGSITLWKEKKSIFRALKAFLFFCGGWGGVGKGRCMDVIGIFKCSEFFVFFFFSLVLFFPNLIRCTELAQEMKRFSLLML